MAKTTNSDRTVTLKKVRGKYTEKDVAQVMAHLRENGLAKTARAFNLPKQTVTRWAQKHDVPVSTAESKGKTANAIEASRLATRERHAKSKQTLVENLSRIAELGTEVEMKRLERALADNGELINVDKLSEIVGARTRAIHDLELLEGRVTERSELVDSTEDILDLIEQLDERLRG